MPFIAYTPGAIEHHEVTRAAAYKEYKRMYDTARHRLERLESKYPKNHYVEYWKSKGGLPTPGSLKTNAALSNALSEVKHMLASKVGSLSGLEHLRKEKIQSLHEHGFTNVTKENFDDFVRFMQAIRDSGYDDVIGSPPVADYANIAIEKITDFEKITEQFQAFISRAAEVENQYIEEHGSYGQDDYVRLQTKRSIRRFLKSKGILVK